MFDFVRKHTKIMQFLLFLLIFPSFVLFGLDGYSRMREKGDAVAKVDGQEIGQNEWDEAHKREVDRIRSQRPDIPASIFDSPEAKYATLEKLVKEKVIAAAADKSRLTTSDVRLRQQLAEDPSIASLRNPDGTIDMARYRQLAASQGMTPEMFEARLRFGMSTAQVVRGIEGTSFSPAVQADVALNAYFERRDVQVARFNTAEFAAKLNPTDGELEAFYKENPQFFQAPEQANVEYLVLDVKALEKGVTVNEADLKTFFEQNQPRLAGQEERRASHILINAPQGAPAADREKARAKAQELLAAARKAPDSFAELARKNSQDAGSAPNGGDLDFFARGAMVKPFEDAAFSMKKGDISNVVESDFGFHVIKLTDVRAPKQRTFEEARPEIEASLRRQEAQKKFTDSVDAFTNGVYENPDSLKAVADRLKLEVRTAANVSRTPAPGVTGPLANPKFLNAIFSPDSVEKKRNTEAVETAANQLVSGRVTQYTPARTMPFADVKERVRERVLAARGAEAARVEGQAKLGAWKAAPASAVLPEAVVVSRDQTQRQPPQVIEAALRADPAALPAFIGVDLGAQGYAVVKVNKIAPRDAAPAQALQQDRQQYAQWWQSAESEAYYQVLKDRFKVQMKVQKPVQRTLEEIQAANR